MTQPLTRRERRIAPETGAYLAAPETTDDDGYPILDAVRIKDPRGDLLAVFCKYCNRTHTHGGGTHPGDGDGHRVAHCWIDDSPYKTGPKPGYVLREVPARATPIARFSTFSRRRGIGGPSSGFLRARARWIAQQEPTS
jgi:hypothetical protein